MGREAPPCDLVIGGPPRRPPGRSLYFEAFVTTARLLRGAVPVAPPARQEGHVESRRCGTVGDVAAPARRSMGVRVRARCGRSPTRTVPRGGSSVLDLRPPGAARRRRSAPRGPPWGASGPRLVPDRRQTAGAGAVVDLLTGPSVRQVRVAHAGTLQDESWQRARDAKRPGSKLVHRGHHPVATCSSTRPRVHDSVVRACHYEPLRAR